MIQRIEKLAADLIPYRKWMLLAFLLAFFLVMPVTAGLMRYFKNPSIFALGVFVFFLGFAWSWGLFLISYWYNPDGGPLTVGKIKTQRPFGKLHSYVMRYTSPAFLVLWFLFPFGILM